jgi:hypothetical protein
LSIASIQFLNVGFWGPHLTTKKMEWLPTKNKSENTSVISQNKIWIKHKDYFGHYRIFDRATNTMHLPNLFFYNEYFKPVKFIRATTAKYIY